MRTIQSAEITTAIKGLFTVGDGAGITRGLMQAGVSGMVAVDEIAGRMSRENA